MRINQLILMIYRNEYNILLCYKLSSFFYLRANRQSPLHVVFVFNPHKVIENGSKQAVWELIELKT